MDPSYLQLLDYRRGFYLTADAKKVTPHTPAASVISRSKSFINLQADSDIRMIHCPLRRYQRRQPGPLRSFETIRKQ
jgi:cytosine/adenosine deaminase-related metal-dependent hydrolase